MIRSIAPSDSAFSASVPITDTSSTRRPTSSATPSRPGEPNLARSARRLAEGEATVTQLAEARPRSRSRRSARPQALQQRLGSSRAPHGELAACCVQGAPSRTPPSGSSRYRAFLDGQLRPPRGAPAVIAIKMCLRRTARARAGGSGPSLSVRRTGSARRGQGAGATGDDGRGGVGLALVGERCSPAWLCVSAGAARPRGLRAGPAGLHGELE